MLLSLLYSNRETYPKQIYREIYLNIFFCTKATVRYQERKAKFKEKGKQHLHLFYLNHFN